MKIMVTGGAGFIGSTVVDAYIAAGHDVVIIDNLESGRVENINPKAKFYLMDVRSPELRKVFELEKIDVINHHAAQKSVPHSVEDPVLDAEINILGILNLLELAVEFGVKRVIFSSTGGALLGDADVIPTPEDSPVQTISPYAITKFTSEKYLDFYRITHGLTYVVLRYANVYGPRQIAEGECGVTPIFLENLLHDRPSKLYAYEDMPDGCTRDYVYVGDVARANVIALDKGDNLIFNIGTGQEVSTGQVYRYLQDATGKYDVPLLPAGERVGDLRRSALDITRARKVLGWEPEVDFPTGLRETVAYFQK
ncbi:MAG TPA: NAD-dependent epimerase/dehydratase family protein [Firmicutes bacterium]|jgi:UDP-glucose 4-epimerase|nr:MAG: UDP-glucose 4-epimerase [Peptococcaceae bacterium 1109]HHT72274.1 NAD-dependent epimerase/dehydratase family protein [Bacillota bacterium]